jgi:hypothetical protein
MTSTRHAQLAQAGAMAQDSRVILIILLGFAPPLMLVTLALALYLTVIELREFRPHYLWWFWWLLLVFLTHFVGYLALRIYTAVRRYREARA